MGVLNTARLVRRRVPVKGKNGKTYFRMQWVNPQDASTGHGVRAIHNMADLKQANRDGVAGHKDTQRALEHQGIHSPRELANHLHEHQSHPIYLPETEESENNGNGRANHIHHGAENYRQNAYLNSEHHNQVVQAHNSNEPQPYDIGYDGLGLWGVEEKMVADKNIDALISHLETMESLPTLRNIAGAYAEKHGKDSFYNAMATDYAVIKEAMALRKLNNDDHYFIEDALEELESQYNYESAIQRYKEGDIINVPEPRVTANGRVVTPLMEHEWDTPNPHVMRDSDFDDLEEDDLFDNPPSDSDGNTALTDYQRVMNQLNSHQQLVAKMVKDRTPRETARIMKKEQYTGHWDRDLLGSINKVGKPLSDHFNLSSNEEMTVKNIFGSDMTIEGLRHIFSIPGADHLTPHISLHAIQAYEYDRDDEYYNPNDARDYDRANLLIYQKDEHGNNHMTIERTVKKWDDTQGYDVHNELMSAKSDEDMGNKYGEHITQRGEQLWMHLAKGNSVDVHTCANISIGVYAWATKGFDFADSFELSAKRSEFTRFCDINGWDVKETLKACGHEHGSVHGLNHAHEFASLDDGYVYDIGAHDFHEDIKGTAHLGKAFMLTMGSSWDAKKTLHSKTSERDEKVNQHLSDIGRGNNEYE